MKPVYFILLCFLFFAPAEAQEINFHFERYTTTNGLTDNSVHQMLQDRHGFLWISSSNGLNRFDGKIFKQYNSFGSNGLTDLSINCLAEDREGNIWIGTENGLNKINPFTQDITHYYEGQGAGTIPYKWCNFLYVDKKQNLWLSTEKGIALYNPSTNSFQNIPVIIHGADARVNKFIDHILEDKKGRFWLATSFGVKLFAPSKKTYQSYHFTESKGISLKENIIISLYEDERGNIWAGTWGGGLLKFNEEKQVFEKVMIKNAPVSNFVVSDISTIQIRNTPYLLLTVLGGLYYLETKDGYQQLVAITAENKTSFPADAFTNLLHDRSGNIWIGGNNGLYKMNTVEPALQSVSFSHTKNPEDFVWHIIPDIKNPPNIFYLSTTAGWWKYESLYKKISKLTLPAYQNKLLRFINDWEPDEHGYWFTSVEGFGYYDLYQNRLTDFTAMVKDHSGQASTGLITKDLSGKLWLSMRRNGILVFDPVTQKSQSFFADTAKPDNVFGYSITDLTCGRDGMIYFCAVNKLYIVNPADFSYQTISPPAYEEQIDMGKIGPEKIIFTQDQRLLVSSKLRIYEYKNHQLQKVYPANGLSDFSIANMNIGSDSSIWLTSSQGIFKTDVAFKKWRNLSTESQKDHTDFLEMLMLKSGEVILNGYGGIGLFNTNLLAKSTAPPKVIISKIKYGEKQVYLASLQPAVIKASYKDAIEIELSAIDFLNDPSNILLYQLDGWDKNWKELNRSTVVRYEQLPAGDYLFKTKVINTEGVESPETILHFEVIPPFYRSWWFILLSILAVGIILYVSYHYRMQKALEMEKLRTRIATDLHDDIGATLSSISMYSQAVKNLLKEKNTQLENVLDKMAENSREMVTSISDIVWAINPDNDDGKKLIQRMENYATDICVVKNIMLHFEADEKISTAILPLEHRKNIYLIFKEALNNAVKYSDAQNIWVKFIIQQKQLSLTVQDDGIGFNEKLVKKGNGLKNLQMRAREIKGMVTIKPVEDEGTTILLICLI
jgi:ligand-binding sensor domain-containing protein/two-component sensor histidine kinase